MRRRGVLWLKFVGLVEQTPDKTDEVNQGDYL